MLKETADQQPTPCGVSGSSKTPDSDIPDVIDALDACDLTLPAIEGAFHLIASAHEFDNLPDPYLMIHLLNLLARETRELRFKMLKLSVRDCGVRQA